MNLKIKVGKDGSKKLVIKGDDDIKKVMSLIEIATDPIYVDDEEFYKHTFSCPRCDEVLCINDNFCNGCGRPIISADQC